MIAISQITISSGTAIGKFNAVVTGKQFFPSKPFFPLNVSRYRVRALPAAGALLKEEDSEEKQIGLLE